LGLVFEDDGKKLSVQLSRPSPKAWTFNKGRCHRSQGPGHKRLASRQGVALRTISLVWTLVVFVYGTYVMSQSDVVIVQEHWLVCILLSNENDDFISFASLLMSKKLKSDTTTTIL